MSTLILHCFKLRHTDSTGLGHLTPKNL